MGRQDSSPKIPTAGRQDHTGLSRPSLPSVTLPARKGPPRGLNTEKRRSEGQAKRKPDGFLRVPREAEENAEVRGQVQTSGGGETAQKPVLPGMGLIRFSRSLLYLALNRDVCSQVGEVPGSQGPTRSAPAFNVGGCGETGRAGLERQAFLLPAPRGSFKLEQGCGGELTDGLLGLLSPTVILPGQDGAATPNLGGFIYQLSW